MLWEFIRHRVKPSTKVGAAKLKGSIKKAKLTDFGDDVTKFNSWFEDTRFSIIAEEGEGYNEYTRMLFQAYLACNNAGFKVSVEKKERKWIQDKLDPDYLHVDPLELGQITFNNLVENESWVDLNGDVETKKEQPYFLALVTEILSKLKGIEIPRNPDASKYNGTKKRTYQEWRYKNPDGKATKDVRGVRMN